MPTAFEPPSTGIRFPNLDALRAIAAIAVLLDHVVVQMDLPESDPSFYFGQLLSFGGHGGRLGVLFFFVLSGFLITYRMHEEKRRNGRLHIGHFYMRRLLRIWPLYYLTLVLGFVAFPVFIGIGQGSSETASPLLYALFLPNFDMLYNGDPQSPILGVHWSLGVEEQFYLLWPLVFVLFRHRGAFALVVLAVCAAAECVIGNSHGRFAYFHLFPNMLYLGSGALLATTVFHSKDRLHRIIDKCPRSLRSLVYVIGVPTLFLLLGWAADYPTRITAVRAATIAFFLFVVVDQSHWGRPSLPMGSIPGLSWLGKRSYGIYLLHMVALVLVYQLTPLGFAGIWSTALLSLALSILLSHLSYRYFESYFLEMKSKFRGGSMVSARTVPSS